MWRWQFPGTLPDPLLSFLVFYGLPVVVFLPITILLLEKYRLLVVLVVYTIVLDLYFLSANQQVVQLIKLGTNGCINTEHAVSYPVNHDLGISLDQLFSEPDQPELDAILAEWSRKDYLQPGLNIATAPILLLLPGKAGQYDVFKTDFLQQEIKSLLGCNDLYKQYIVAMPSFRGNALRGKDFCFRSSGYSMDTWLGAALRTLRWSPKTGQWSCLA